MAIIQPTSHSLPFDDPPEPVVSSNEIALDEALDTLDPLRHLRTDPSNFAGDDEDTVIVPSQPRSILGETIRLTFPVDSPLVSISLKVDASNGCGGIAWPAGEVLSNYIAFRGIGYLQGKKIVEVGSGTGCDNSSSPLLGIMQQNVTLNNLQSCVSVRELNWGETLPSDMPPPELILAADCVYFEPAFPLLVQTLSEMAVSGSTEILFCYKKRRKADKRFFAMLKKQFSWEEVEDDPNREIYNREAISLLSLTKRP
ncbi:putative methyltransferase-domain-containing protein [Suillus spraguei]|nr:putative methyltransferase-domain-containing protein [Suillus spraguei]